MYGKATKPVVRNFGIVSFLAISLILISPSRKVSAETNCREIARNTQLEVIESSDAKQLKTEEEFIALYLKVFSKSLLEYPECRQELKIVTDWNIERNANKPFPFPKSEDPKSYVLGPIGWWWDKIYNGLFGGNTILMFFSDGSYSYSRFR